MDNWPVSALGLSCRPPSIFVFPEAIAAWCERQTPLKYSPVQAAAKGRRVPILCIASCPKKRCRWLPFRYDQLAFWFTFLRGVDGIAGAAGPPGIQGPASSSLDRICLQHVFELPELQCLQPCPGPPWLLWPMFQGSNDYLSTAGGVAFC